MWKKLIVMGIALLGTFSVVYTINRDINATTIPTYNAGGAVSGRINQAPVGLTGSNIGMKKGDKILMGTLNPFDGLPLSWQLIQEKTYTDHAKSCVPSATSSCSGEPLTGWFSMSTRKIDFLNPGFLESDFTSYLQKLTKGAAYTNSAFYSRVQSLQGEISSSSKDYAIVTYRNLTNAHKVYNTSLPTKDKDLAGMIEASVFGGSNQLGRSIFVYSTTEISPTEAVGIKAEDAISKADMTFSEDYGSSVFYYSTANPYILLRYDYKGIVDDLREANMALTSSNKKTALRPSVYLNMEDVVFALQQGTTNNHAVVTEHILPSSYTSIYNQTESFKEMKVRIENTELTSTTVFNNIENKKATTITKAGKDSIVYLDASAKTGSSGNSVNTVSAIIFDKDNNFKYYKPLEPAKGAGKYALNLKDIPLGNYKIGIVNEVYNEASTAPADCSKIKGIKNLEIVKPLSDLTYSTSHGVKTDDAFMSSDKGNTLKGNTIATLTTLNGIGNEVIEGVFENGVTYNLQPSKDTTHANDKDLFMIPTDQASGKMLLDVDKKPYVIVNTENTDDYLAPGVYKYRVQAYDANGDPVGAKLNDGTVVSGISPDQGLIIDDITTVVYPHEKQLTNTQNKNTGTKAYYTLDELKGLATNTVLGELEFSTDANINLLSNAGYVISSIKAVMPGTTATLTAFEVKAVTGNNDKFEIKKLAGDNFVKGDLKYDLIITYSKDDVTTAVIKKTDQTFSIPDGLKYADPKDSSKFLKDATYKYIYDSETNKNELTIVATDKSAGTALNKDVTYCILENNACVASSSVITFVTPSNAGSQKITIEAPGTEKKSAMIRATLMDEAGKEIITHKDLTIEIEPTKQKLSWAGTNIQSTGNSITKDTKDPIQTWNLSMKYDKTTASNNEITLAELNHEATLSDKQIGLTSNVVSGTGLLPTYKITPSNRDDEGSVKIEGGKLKVTKPLKDTVTILASGAAVGNYSATMDDDTTTTDVNEYSHAKLVISVSEKPTVTFTEAFTDSIIIKGTMAEGTESLGDVGISPSTESGYTYAVKSVKKVNEETSTPEDIKYDIEDSAIFTIKETTKLFVNKPKSISKGTYVVEIKGTKGSEEATTKEVTIQVSEASLDVTKLKWQYKEDKSFIDAAGTINKTGNLNTETLSQTYKKDKSFYVKLENVVGSTLITGEDTITYKLKDNSSAKVISVSNTGKVDILGASPTDGSVIIEASITKDGYGTTKVYIPIKIEKADVEMQFVNKNSTPYVLTNANDKTKYKTQSFVYAPDTGVDVFTSNAPSGVDVTLSIVSTASTGNDILTFKDEEATANADTATKTCLIAKDDYITQSKTKCQAQILNAQKIASDNGKVTLKASVPESANYKALTIEMLINITQAEQTDFGFVDPDITVESNIDGTFDPVFVNTQGSGLIMLATSNLDSGADSDFTNEELELNYDGASVDNEEFYVDGVSGYRYNILVPKDKDEQTGLIYARKGSDRNYKASSLKSSTLHILREGASLFITTLVSYPSATKNKLTYGDAYFTIEAKSDEDDPDNKPTYTYEVDDTSTDIIAVKDGGEPNEFIILKATTANTRGRIKITRTDPSGSTKTSTVSFVINKKQLKVQVENVSKKVGMSVKAPELKFTSASEDFLATDKANIKAALFTSKNADAEELVDGTGVLLAQDNQVISASYEKNPILDNYQFVNVTNPRTLGIENGKLIVTQDESLASWIEVKAATDTILGNDSWYNGDVDVLLKKIAGSYDQLSHDQETWESEKLTLSKEGQNKVDIYFRQSKGDEEDATSTSQVKEIKIDITIPTIKSVTGNKVNDSGIAKFMNTATFGTFFKPGVEVVMESEDTNADTTIKTSGIASIEYKAYAKDGESFKEIDKGSATLSGTTGKIKLADAGVYRVCAIAKDNAGNESDEYCSELDVKMIDIDLDGDGKPDMNDSNDDGCPDLNIVLGKDSNGKWIKLNIDNDGDKLPELNIDSDGDGIAELNIDTDGDGKPDINLVNVTKDIWKPEFHVSDQSEEYCTTKGLKATINIKVSETSYINIDNNGDMKADVNITKEGSTKPTINLLLDETIVWKPNKDFTKDGLAYDTMDTLKPELNIDSDDDGLPDLNVDMDGDRKPDINVDINGDGIPDINIDGNGDGERDYNIDTNGDGEADDNNIDLDEWNPSIKGDDFGTMDVVTKDELEDGGIKVERPNGKFLANYALRVNDVTDSISDAEKESIGSVMESNQEIKQVYNVAMMKGETTIQPNGNLKVRIPIVKGLKNPKMVITQKDGSQKIVDAIEDNGYYVYESDYLGNVSIIGDKDEAPVEKEEPPVENEEPKTPSIVEKPVLTDTSVKGNYTSSGGIGGAGTGDRTNIVILMFTGLLSGVYVLTQLRSHKKQ